MELSHHKERPEVVQRTVDDLSLAGYNLCQLNLEDAYFYPSHPDLAPARTFDAAFMKDLAARCAARGMELVPVIPSLGHCAYITEKPAYAHLDEGRGTARLHGTVSPSFPETYALLGDLYADWCREVPGRYLHVGLDESPAVGFYEQRTSGTGGRPAVELFASHCNRLNAIAKRLGRRMIMWGDMFLHYPHAMDLVDHDIIIAEWQYFLFPRAPLVECHDNRETDTAGRLRRAGFEVWGVPSVWPCNPVCDIEERWTNVRDWIRYGRETGIAALVVSDWGNRLELFCISHFVMRVIARSIETDAVHAADAVGWVLGTWLAGEPAVPALARDLGQIGRFQTRVFMDDKRYKQPLCGFLADAPERRAECRDKTAALAKLFGELPAARDRAVGEGRTLLEAVRLSHEYLRLDVRWRCDHVPMGNFEVLCRWEDGAEERFAEPMYGCEPVLPAPLYRFSTDVLNHRTPPAEIEITTDSYGRAVIEAVVVSIGGVRLGYTPDRMAGPHVAQRADGVEIGPISMDPELPPLRTERDQVWYRLAL